MHMTDQVTNIGVHIRNNTCIRSHLHRDNKILVKITRLGVMLKELTDDNILSQVKSNHVKFTYGSTKIAVSKIHDAQQ